MVKNIVRPTTAVARQKRVDMALEEAKRYEMNIDSRIGDENLKEDIKFVFHTVDLANGLVRYIDKDKEAEFWDNPWFRGLSESQLRAVRLYVSALTELTFAEAALLGLPEEKLEGGNEYGQYRKVAPK